MRNAYYVVSGYGNNYGYMAFRTLRGCIPLVIESIEGWYEGKDSKEKYENIKQVLDWDEKHPASSCTSWDDEGNPIWELGDIVTIRKYGDDSE